MLAEVAEAYPVYSFASGPTNSMRGAAFLSRLADALVVDVGGTTTDVGALRHGFPREANNVVEVGGVRTLFRMPDLLSLALGGGTLVADGPLRVGPVSVGYQLTERALVFGGRDLTVSDVAVAAGLCDIGDRARDAWRRTRRSARAPTRPPSRSSKWRTCRSRTCRATRCGRGCEWWGRSRGPRVSRLRVGLPLDGRLARGQTGCVGSVVHEPAGG